MKKYGPVLILLSLFVFTMCDTTNSGTSEEEVDDVPDVPEIVAPDGYSFVWSDEFNEPDIDSENWNYETGDGTDYNLPAGWGNNELQLYTTDPANSSIIEDGGESVLAITALSDGSGGYTSAKMTTRDKVSVRYGRIDVRAKMPQGQGVWPAVWMLGDNFGEVEWPGSGEIDIIEVLGDDPTTYYSTLHFTDGENSKGEVQQEHNLSQGSFSDDYHLFTLEWDHESLVFSLDSVEVAEMIIEDDMKEFQRSFYLIMNIAVGGYWPGNPDNTTTFPQSLLVDYVRVFSKDNYSAPDEPPLDLDEETLGGVLEDNIAYNGIREGFNDLGFIDIITYGGGGQPDISKSDTSINGGTSLVYEFSGTSWGGAYFEMDEPRDISGYSNLKFSLNTPELFDDAEIKLESPTSAAAIFLIDYTPVEVEKGFVEYTIPLEDFTGLTLTEIDIPFAIWNPKAADGSFIEGTVLIDNLYFE